MLRLCNEVLADAGGSWAELLPAGAARLLAQAEAPLIKADDLADVSSVASFLCGPSGDGSGRSRLGAFHIARREARCAEASSIVAARRVAADEPQPLALGALERDHEAAALAALVNEADEHALFAEAAEAGREALAEFRSVPAPWMLRPAEASNHASFQRYASGAPPFDASAFDPHVFVMLRLQETDPSAMQRDLPRYGNLEEEKIKALRRLAAQPQCPFWQKEQLETLLREVVQQQQSRQQQYQAPAAYRARLALEQQQRISSLQSQMQQYHNQSQGKTLSGRSTSCRRKTDSRLSRAGFAPCSGGSTTS